MAQATDTSPIQVTNTLPVFEGSGLSTPKSARLNDIGQVTIGLSGHIESHANNAGRNRETLILDGESHSVALKIEWGFAKRWQAFASAKALRNTGGQLDNIIDEWHDFFGFDDGDRDTQGRDQLLFLYDDGDGATQISDSNSALSDVQLGIGHQLISSSGFNLAIHGELNVPNGKTNQALGSDKLDVSLSLAASGSGSSLGWHSNLGVLAIGDDTLFNVPSKSSTWFSSLGAHWQPSSSWRWSAQIDGHGAVFDSAIDELDSNAWQLAIATEWRLNKSSLQLYFTEDLSVNKSADFAFGLNLKYSLR